LSCYFNRFSLIDRLICVIQWTHTKPACSPSVMNY